MKRTRFKTNGTPLVDDNIHDYHTPNFEHMMEEGKYAVPDTTGKTGRLLFKNDFLRQVYYLARLGARDSDIAEFFSVGSTTVDEWKIYNKEFSQMLKEGRWVFGMKVADTLGKRALGYDYTEVEYSQHVDRFGKKRKLKKVSHKHMPPDVLSLQFILKNRFRELWCDISKTEVEAKMQFEISKKMDFNVFSDQEKQMLKSILVKEVSSIQGYGAN